DLFITHALSKAKAANASKETPTKRLIEIIDEFVKVFDLYKAHLSVFYQEAFFLDDKYEVIIKAKRNEFKYIIINVLLEGIKEKVYRKELDVEITTLVILVMLNCIYNWYNTNGETLIKEISDIYTDLILRSVLINK